MSNDEGIHYFTQTSSVCWVTVTQQTECCFTNRSKSQYTLLYKDNNDEVNMRKPVGKNTTLAISPSAVPRQYLALDPLVVTSQQWLVSNVTVNADE